MNNVNVNQLFLTNEKFKFVAVTFHGSNQVYHYKTVLDVAEGDIIVVDTPSSGMTCVTVKAIVDALDIDLDKYNYKWVVQKVDTEHYETMQSREKEAKTLLLKHRQQKAVQEFENALLSSVGQEGIEAVKKIVRL